jgi:hypothetical protein
MSNSNWGTKAAAFVDGRRRLRIIGGDNSNRGAVARDEATGKRVDCCYVCGHPEDEHTDGAHPKGDSDTDYIWIMRPSPEPAVKPESKARYIDLSKGRTFTPRLAT